MDRMFPETITVPVDWIFHQNELTCMVVDSGMAPEHIPKTSHRSLPHLCRNTSSISVVLFPAYHFLLRLTACPAPDFKPCPLLPSLSPPTAALTYFDQSPPKKRQSTALDFHPPASTVLHCARRNLYPFFGAIATRCKELGKRHLELITQSC